jgi:hypothetical protein
MEISKTQAIVNLMPNSPFMWRDGALEWLDETQTQPTDAEIAAEVTRLQGV